jgi:hypothetical protein
MSILWYIAMRFTSPLHFKGTYTKHFYNPSCQATVILIDPSTGLGKKLMGMLDTVASNIPGVAKVMLTCFTFNTRAMDFYAKQGFTTDEFSPPPRILRNGTKVESQYVILSKPVRR